MDIRETRGDWQMLDDPTGTECFFLEGRGIVKFFAEARRFTKYFRGEATIFRKIFPAGDAIKRNVVFINPGNPRGAPRFIFY